MKIKETEVYLSLLCNFSHWKHNKGLIIVHFFLLCQLSRLYFSFISSLVCLIYATLIALCHVNMDFVYECWMLYVLTVGDLCDSCINVFFCLFICSDFNVIFFPRRWVGFDFVDIALFPRDWLKLAWSWDIVSKFFKFLLSWDLT